MNYLNSKITIPFLKWPGGKRWFIRKYSYLFPQNYNCFFEPFLGSGSVYFHLKPKKSVLSDINLDLINTYRAIQLDWLKVNKLLVKHHNNHCEEYYYKIRSRKYTDIFSNAAQFIYLNRTCWNGLYRVNKKGEFNVPIGTKENVILKTDDFLDISNVLHGTKLLNEDFEKVINRSRANDFIFVDPPYVINHNKNGFIKYNEKIFKWSDQVRLASSLKEATQRGVIVLSTNANHESIVELYKDQFCLKPISRKSTMAADSFYRNEYEELIITNIEVHDE